MANLALISTGVITSIGANTSMVYAAANAGITNIHDVQYFNNRGRPIRMANIPEGVLPPLIDRLAAVKQFSSSHAHMIRIASHALLECLTGFNLKVPPALFMACPECIPGAEVRLYNGFIGHLQEQLEFSFDLDNSRQISIGRAGGLHAVEHASKHLENTGQDFALVGGVDSYKYCLQQLSVLDNEKRLMVEGSSDGFVPGEAAGFLLLASSSAIKTYGLTPSLWLSTPGRSSEPGHRYSSDNYLGNGLASAFRDALTQQPEIQIDTIYSTLNGEAFGSKELSVAMTRSNKRLSPDVEVKHLADCFGDIGAAFGPVLIGFMSKIKNCSSLAYCSSDMEHRSAICAWN